MRKISPNLPKSKVKRAYISYIFPSEMLKELEIQGVFGVKLNPSKNISSEIRYHPDILTLNDPDNKWYCESGYPGYPEMIKTNTELSDQYPYDCAFNMMFVKEWLVCGKNADTGFLDDKYAVLRVNQGYVKCSAVCVNENAYITSDCGIAKVLKEIGCDVLTVDNDGILLNGFSCGFIGGCAGKISENEIVFTGDLKKYKSGKNITDFCDNYGIDCISLSGDNLYDYGGILPIIE